MARWLHHLSTVHADLIRVSGLSAFERHTAYPVRARVCRCRVVVQAARAASVKVRHFSTGSPSGTG